LITQIVNSDRVTRVIVIVGPDLARGDIGESLVANVVCTQISVIAVSVGIACSDDIASFCDCNTVQNYLRLCKGWHCSDDKQDRQCQDHTS
jgi:hypothetical protein